MFGCFGQMEDKVGHLEVYRAIPEKRIYTSPE
jgi:hypothetical protein